MKRVLVLCIGNSCRSQMAEGYLRFYGKGKAQYCSAGLYPTDIHPFAIQVMAEDSIDITVQTPKLIETFREQHFDYVISMCDEITSQLPDYIFADHLLEFHLPDPASFIGTEEAVLEEFRRIRELIKTRILKFIGQELIQKEMEVMIDEQGV